MLEAVEPRDHVVVLSLSRLARNLEQAIDIEKAIRERRGTLAALDCNLDTSTPVGRFVFHVMSSSAQLEREQIAERVSINLNHISGHHRLKTKPPFGFKSPGKGSEFVHDEGEQKTLARIRQLKEEQPHITPSMICRVLENEGHQCRKARKWWPARLKVIMQQAHIIP